MREQAVELYFERALRGRERLRLALRSGVVINQPGLAQAVDRRDALDPPLTPARQVRIAGRAFDEVAPLMGPAEAESTSFLNRCR